IPTIAAISTPAEVVAIELLLAVFAGNAFAKTPAPAHPHIKPELAVSLREIARDDDRAVLRSAVGIHVEHTPRRRHHARWRIGGHGCKPRTVGDDAVAVKITSRGDIERRRAGEINIGGEGDAARRGDAASHLKLVPPVELSPAPLSREIV